MMGHNACYLGDNGIELDGIRFRAAPAPLIFAAGPSTWPGAGLNVWKTQPPAASALLENRVSANVCAAKRMALRPD